ncbi:SAM-dependent methyltransferase [Mucisphaera calidilacus]|uniref:16S/23S rRNA (Cytidine-2'-O)-methyltransferase TlyA n=1 Tax=Mucisphaera calidilacus TaxID=2527982 RepID=A0A518C1A4_9BACT|nr:SAM-dependent methyltransferase [Mucisphaera calidilacus]QDU73001.1 16S/23S rRNA (cytidine-2'-O)-methyltransferase TlyA [Mucisphaera calidilacus]
MTSESTPSESSGGFVSRAGAKLEAALTAFNIDVAGLACADLGCSTGGFTDCLIQRQAARVYAVDTAYGELAWKLRQHPNVITLERQNALHLDPNGPHHRPKTAKLFDDFQGVHLVTIDLGWTKLNKALPAALQWLRHDQPTTIIPLIKPHYESGQHQLSDAEAQRISHDVAETLANDQIQLKDLIPSPVRGGKGNNLEFLAHLAINPS